VRLEYAPLSLPIWTSSTSMAGRTQLKVATVLSRFESIKGDAPIVSVMSCLYRQFRRKA